MQQQPDGAGRPAPQVPPATPRRLAAGIGWQSLGRLAQAFSSLGVLALLTGSIDLGLVGVFGAYLALYGLLDVAVDAGSGLALLRRASAQPAALRGVLRRAQRFRAASAVLAASVGWLHLALDADARALGPWGWIAPLTLFGHLAGVHAVPFHIRLRFEFLSVVRGGSALAAFAAALVLHRGGLRDPLAFLLVVLAGRQVANLIIWVGARPLMREYAAAADDRPEHLLGFARESLQLGAGHLMREAYGRLDLLFLRAFLGNDAAGLYTPARAAMQLALLLPSYLLTVVLPPLAAQAQADSAAFLKRCRRLAIALAAFAVPAALLSLPLAPWFLETLFDAEYLAAVPALRWLAFAAALAYPGSVLLTGLVARGAARATLGASAAALAVNLVCLVALVPWLGLAGAAIARLAAEAAMLVVSAARLR